MLRKFAPGDACMCTCGCRSTGEVSRLRTAAEDKDIGVTWSSGTFEWVAAEYIRLLSAPELIARIPVEADDRSG